jgi:hypothetical protein
VSQPPVTAALAELAAAARPAPPARARARAQFADDAPFDSARLAGLCPVPGPGE